MNVDRVSMLDTLDVMNFRYPVDRLIVYFNSEAKGFLFNRDHGGKT